MHPLNDFIPRIFECLEEPGFEARLAGWKERFWTLTGIPHPGSTGYEARLHAFEEWVLVDFTEHDRILPGTSPAPVDRASLLALLVRCGALSGELEALARDLVASQLGLYVLMAPWTGPAWFRELVSGADFRLDEGPPVPGLEPGQILQTRLFVHGGRTWAGLGRLIHPLGATETIHRLVERLHARGRTRLEILHLLAKLAWRADNYPRHAPELFYDLSHPLVQDLVVGWR
jgi:hypothetical protein